MEFSFDREEIEKLRIYEDSTVMVVEDRSSYIRAYKYHLVDKTTKKDIATWTGEPCLNKSFHLVQLNSKEDGAGSLAVNILKRLYNKITGESIAEAFEFWKKMNVDFGKDDITEKDLEEAYAVDGTFYFEIKS